MKNQGKMYLEFKRRGCHSKIYLITYMEDSMWMQLILVAYAVSREYNIKGEVIYEQKGQIIRETFAEAKRFYI